MRSMSGSRGRCRRTCRHFRKCGTCFSLFVTSTFHSHGAICGYAGLWGSLASCRTFRTSPGWRHFVQVNSHACGVPKGSLSFETELCDEQSAFIMRLEFETAEPPGFA